jgi:single-stranded-DNA-specific exonuclease
MTNNGSFLENKFSAKGSLWKERVSDLEKISIIENENKIPKLLAKILAGREIISSDVNSFLNPEVNKLILDPSKLFDLDRSVDYITECISKKEKIGILGDYDVDGATSSSILKLFFDYYGVKTEIYIPDRLKEGYGPNKSAIDFFYDNGINTFITVDCGATSIEPMVYAAAKGMNSIIIDHHKVDNNLPESYAHINPSRNEDNSGLNDLAAVGLTFIFVVGLRRAIRDKNIFPDIPEPSLKQYLDLVALGTVCDVVQLKGLNRAFVKEGIDIISKNSRLGIDGLRSISGSKDIGVTELGYRIGPRINAAGRTGASDLGVRLLTSNSEDEVLAISERLNNLNKQRQNIEETVLFEAINNIENNISIKKLNTFPNSVIVSGENWHLGVLGIVASRLKDKYYRPSFVLSSSEGKLTGSARSISGIDVGKLIIKAVNKNLLVTGGGHKMAAGFSLYEDTFEKFRNFCEEEIYLQLNSTTLDKINYYDEIIDSSNINRDLYNLINVASPYGQGNPEPQFIIKNAKIDYWSEVGNGHLKIKISNANYGNIDAIAFSSKGTPLGDIIMNHSGSLLHFAGVIKKNDWQGNKAVQFHIRDLFTA